MMIIRSAGDQNRLATASTASKSFHRLGNTSCDTTVATAARECRLLTAIGYDGLTPCINIDNWVIAGDRNRVTTAMAASVSITT